MANEAEKTLHEMQQVLRALASTTACGSTNTVSSGMSCRTHTAVNGYCPVY